MAHAKRRPRETGGVLVLPSWKYSRRVPPAIAGAPIMPFNGEPDENGTRLATPPAPTTCLSLIVTGGGGHTRNAVPNEVGPECDGYGQPKVWIKDLHSLTNGDRALIKSVDKIRYGPWYRFHDRQMALSVLARHLRIGTNQPIVASPATVSNALADMQSRGAKFT